MATYSQWLKHPKYTRVTWLCGNEDVLTWAMLSAYRQALPVLRPQPVWVGGPGVSRVWDELLTVPPGPQLVVVRGAERLHDLTLLPQLLTDTFDGSYLVLVSTEDDFRKGEDKKLDPALASLRDSKHGQMVRCCAPASEEDAAGMVASWWPGCGKNVAAALLAACGGSLTQAWHAADKAVRAGIVPDVRAIPMVSTRTRTDDYADLLLAGNRRAAMAAAAQVGPEEAGKVIALMASRLALLPLVRDSLQRRESPQDAVRRLRVDAYVLRLLRPHATDYTPERVAQCRRTLAIAETAWRAGSRTGVLEAVAALW